MGGDSGLNQESETENGGMVEVKPQTSHPQARTHPPIAIALRQAEINPSREQSGQQDEAFGRRHKAERLIDQRAGDRGQMGESHPYEHQSPRRIEFQSPLHECQIMSARLLDRYSIARTDAPAQATPPARAPPLR